MKRLAYILLLLLLVTSAAAEDSIRIRSCNTGKNRGHALTRSISRTTNNARIGNKRQMVVLASFADKQFKSPNPLQLWDRIFNETGFAEDKFNGSIHDYFYDQSYGKFQLQFDLHHVSLANNRVKYASTVEDDDNSQYLVYDIVDTLINRGSIDWSPYDWDDDGYIDQIIIIFAGMGQNSGGGPNTIWPHHGFLTWHTDGHTKTVTSKGKSFTINRYCCIQEENSRGEYGSFGTICHEYSHCFDLPDIYYGSTQIVGKWDLMDYGNYNGDGFRPCNYSAFERMLMGWIDVQELSSPTEINNMAAMTDSPQAYLIRNNGYSSEYYIIENRQQKGWDSDLPASGLIIFHIDYDETVWKDLTQNINDPKAGSEGIYRYTIIPANNQTSVGTQKEWAYPHETNNSLTNLSSPAAILYHANTDNTFLMSKPISNIRVENGLAGFSFMAGSPSGIATIPTESLSQEAIYDLYGRRLNTSAIKPGLYIIKYKNGETKKVVLH